MNQAKAMKELKSRSMVGDLNTTTFSGLEKVVPEPDTTLKTEYGRPPSDCQTVAVVNTVV